MSLQPRLLLPVRALQSWSAGCFLSLALLVPLTAGAQEEPVSDQEPSQEEAVQARAIEEITDDPQLARLIQLSRDLDGARRHIEVITSHFPNRLTGCSQLQLAQGWAVGTFEDWGIPASLEPWGEVEVGFDRGPKSGRVVSPEERSLTFVTPCWSPGTAGAQEGPALREPASLEELQERKDDFKGAWVLRHPKAERSERDEYEELFLEVGALGRIRPGIRDGRLSTGGSWDIEWENLPRLVEIKLLFEEFEALATEAQAAAETGADPVRLEFDIQDQFLHGPIPQHNVVAEITGSEFPDEFVIVQGHIDAWDGAEGACDNGTGVATTLEAARLIMFADIVPRRSIRFVLYSGEEQGLHGSKGYVEKHVEELENISVVFNHDNGTNYLRGIGVTAAMLEDFQTVFAPIQRLDPTRPFEIWEVQGLRPGPSDHGPFVEAGVPAFHWDQSRDGYRRLHHTQFDTLAEVNHEDQRHSALVVAMAAVGFADLDHKVDRSFMREPDPRRMGVYLGGERGRFLERVMGGSLAEKAGWQQGDEIISMDGVEMKNRRQITSSLQEGGPKKSVVLARGEEQIETVLDFTDDPLEKERSAWRIRRAEEAAAEEAAAEEAAAEEAAAEEDSEEE